MWKTQGNTFVLGIPGKIQLPQYLYDLLDFPSPCGKVDLETANTDWLNANFDNHQTLKLLQEKKQLL